MTYDPNLHGKTLSEAEKAGYHRSNLSGEIKDSWGRPVHSSKYGNSTYQSSGGSTISEKRN